jgi:hypothetical protein
LGISQSLSFLFSFKNLTRLFDVPIEPPANLDLTGNLNYGSGKRQCQFDDSTIDRRNDRGHQGEKSR